MHVFQRAMVYGFLDRIKKYFTGKFSKRGVERSIESTDQQEDRNRRDEAYGRRGPHTFRGGFVTTMKGQRPRYRKCFRSWK